MLVWIRKSFVALILQYCLNAASQDRHLVVMTSLFSVCVCVCVCVCVLPVSRAMTYTLMSVSPSLAGGHFMSDALGCVFDRQQSRGASVSIKQHQSRENRTLTDIRVNIGPLFSGGLQPVSICNVDAANAGFT